MHSTKSAATDSTRRSKWRKSSYSGPSGGECLEVSDGHASIPVRDSKNPTGPALAFSTGSWSAFVAAVKSDSLNA
ncbi:DUF397 domain-containing protein [Streptomyces sp. NPDC002225]|uniref:DUF397 domain-containing protein n=1 Tax=Streptomyces sp. NPDC002225 TaxID=3154413 RepID=UPI00331F5C86